MAPPLAGKHKPKLYPKVHAGPNAVMVTNCLLRLTGAAHELTHPDLLLNSRRQLKECLPHTMCAAFPRWSSSLLIYFVWYVWRTGWYLTSETWVWAKANNICVTVHWKTLFENGKLVWCCIYHMTSKIFTSSGGKLILPLIFLLLYTCHTKMNMVVSWFEWFVFKDNDKKRNL